VNSVTTAASSFALAARAPLALRQLHTSSTAKASEPVPFSGQTGGQYEQEVPLPTVADQGSLAMSLRTPNNKAGALASLKAVAQSLILLVCSYF